MKEVNFLISRLQRILIYTSLFFTISLYASGFSDITPYVLFDFEDDFDVSKVETRYSSASLVTNKTGYTLRIETNPSVDWSGFGQIGCNESCSGV